MANIGGRSIISATPGTTVTVTVHPETQHTIARWTAAQATTVNISGTPVDGQELTLMIANDGVLPRVVTLGAGLTGIGVITGTVNKRAVLTFVADGGVFYECSRTLAL